MKNNSEAKNQIYNGIFRAPFSFIFGGPIGLLYNIIFTKAKVDNENKSEIKRKKYIESQFKSTKTLKEYKNETKTKANNKKTEECDCEEYLIEQFKGCDDLSDNNMFISYVTKDMFTNSDRTYDVILRKGMKIKRGRYYPINIFINMYNEAIANNHVKSKYTFYNNNIRGTFCYEIDDADVDFFITGMFTQI